jgi:Cohesin domain
MQHKKALSLFIILVVMAAVNVLTVGAQDSSTPTISILPDVQQASSGQEFNVTIQVAGASQIYGTSFKLAFDPQSFEVVPDGSNVVTPGAFFEGKPGFPLKNAVDDITGIVDYGLTLTSPAEPVSGDGIIGTVRFRALKDAAVTVNATEASLVSPVFSEVDGHKIAESINNVPVQIVQSSAPDAESAVASASMASVQDDPLAMFDNPALNSGLSAAQQPVPVQGQPSQLPMIAAGVFFSIGLVLLTISVGMYSRMRVRFNMMTMKDI